MPITVTKHFDAVKALGKNQKIKVGYPEETTGRRQYDNGFTVAHNAAVQVFGNPNNTTPRGVAAPIPARDFFGLGFSNWSNDWAKSGLAKNYVRSIESENPSLIGEAIGVSLSGFLGEALTSGNWQSNSQFTIDSKGSSTPLRDSGILAQSIDYVVNND